MTIKVVPPEMEKLANDVLDSTLASSWNQPVSAHDWDGLQEDPRFGFEIRLIMGRMFTQEPYSRRRQSGILHLADNYSRRDDLTPARLERFLKYKRMAVVAYSEQQNKIVTSVLAPMIVHADDLPESNISCFNLAGWVLMRQLWYIRPKGRGVNLLDLAPLVVCGDLDQQTECRPIARQHLAELGWDPTSEPYEPSTLVVVSIAFPSQLINKRIGLSFIIIKPPEPMTANILDALFPLETAV